MFGEPQLSVAIALPAAGTPDGLHASVESAGQNVNTGACVSVVQLKCCTQVELLPHASVAVYVRFCVDVQPVVFTVPSALVIFGEPQLSVAVALPAAGTPDGLHPSVESAGQNVNTGACVSVVQLKCCTQVELLPQPSVAVYV